MNLSAYNKAIAAVVIAVLGWGGVVVSSEATAVTASEWLSLAVALATALGVYSVANESEQARDESGQVSPGVLLVVVVLLVLVILLATGRL